MKKTRLLGAACGFILVLISFSTAASLEVRLGGLAIYDRDLNITWLADMDLAYSQKFDVPGVTTNMGWYAAHCSNECIRWWARLARC
jgi:hypothetical protein